MASSSSSSTLSSRPYAASSVPGSAASAAAGPPDVVMGAHEPQALSATEEKALFQLCKQFGRADSEKFSDELRKPEVISLGIPEKARLAVALLQDLQKYTTPKKRAGSGSGGASKKVVSDVEALYISMRNSVDKFALPARFAGAVGREPASGSFEFNAAPAAAADTSDGPQGYIDRLKMMTLKLFGSHLANWTAYIALGEQWVFFRQAFERYKEFPPWKDNQWKDLVELVPALPGFSESGRLNTERALRQLALLCTAFPRLRLAECLDVKLFLTNIGAMSKRMRQSDAEKAFWGWNEPSELYYHFTGNNDNLIAIRPTTAELSLAALTSFDATEPGVGDAY